MASFRIEPFKRHAKNIDSSLFFAHTHECYELFCFLSGDAAFSVEGNVYPLKSGDLILLNKAETHHIIHRSNSSYTRMCAHFWDTKECHPDFKELLLPFKNRPLGFYNRYSSRLFPEQQQIRLLESIVNTVDETKRQVLLMALLQELCDLFPEIQKTTTIQSEDDVTKITHYINTHLDEPLHLEDICEQFFISKSQLQRKFNFNLGTTIGDYILTKRLMLAQSLIAKGKKPTEIFVQCGFQNYSGFFKAYKKYFGYSPSQKIPENITPPSRIFQ